MTAHRLFDTPKKPRWTGSRALVPIPPNTCPACGWQPLTDETVSQQPLLRHGGYGAAKRTVMRRCRCGWRIQVEQSEVKP